MYTVIVLIIAIDSYSLEWGHTVWGIHLEKWTVLLISFPTRVSNKCANTVLLFFTIWNYWQMIITSTVNPVLEVGLRLLGVWPGVSYSTVHWLSFMSSMLIIQYFQYVYVFEHLKISEITNLIDALTVTSNYSLTFLKLVSLWIYRR